MIFNPKVNKPVIALIVAAALPDDQEGGRLPAALVATRALACIQRGHEPIREPEPGVCRAFS